MVTETTSFPLTAGTFSRFVPTLTVLQRRRHTAVIKQAHAQLCFEVEEAARPLFDDWFLLNTAPLQFKQCVAQGRLPTVFELCRAWVAQLGTAAQNRDQKAQRIQPVCTRFLELLTAVSQLN